MTTKTKHINRRADSKTANLAELERLTQQQASWLIARPASWLRDHSHELPRNADGTYNAAELLAWRVRRPVDILLSDCEYEQLQQAAEMYGVGIGSAGHAVRLLLAELRDRHGDAGLAMFGEAVLGVLGAESMRPPTETEIEAELQRKLEIDRRWELIKLYSAKLESVHKCEHCGKVRHGRRWTAPSKRYPTEAFLASTCPKCEAKNGG